MIRPTSRVEQLPSPWLFFVRYLYKCFKLRYLIPLFIILILCTYIRIIHQVPSDEPTPVTRKTIIIPKDITLRPFSFSEQCNYDQIESILKYSSSQKDNPNDQRPKPTIERLNQLFRILISHEEKYREIFDELNIFRFTDIANTLQPFGNDTQRLQNIYCLFQRYLTVDPFGHIEIQSELIFYLQQISKYLSDGFRNEHSNWNNISKEVSSQPVIILAANSRFYDTLQSSMKTVNKHLQNFSIAIYDLGFSSNQLEMIKENCQRCMIIRFPFTRFESIAPHVKNLGNFAWKPLMIQDALRRFGTIIYGDTSIRYRTSNFNRLLIDNSLRGFSCRELPGHYLPCFTLEGTFQWFNESYSSFNDIYIAEAGFVAVTDNFLSRLVLKTWITCALNQQCIAPRNSRTKCSRKSGGMDAHRYDQSAMVVVLSYYFFPSPRIDQKSDPAPYDMYASIQANIAEVRRFEGSKNYFTHRTGVTEEKKEKKD